MPENETEHGTVWMNPDFSTLTVWSLNFGCADRTRHSQQTILLLCTRQLPEALDFTGSYLSTFPSAELIFFGNTATVQHIQAVANAHNEGSACTDMQTGCWNLGNSCLAAETLRELVARWPFFFVFTRWLCNCRKERNLLTAIHPLPVPHPRVQLCVFGACGNGYRLLPGCADWWQLGWFCIPDRAMDRQASLKVFPLTNYCDTFVTSTVCTQGRAAVLHNGLHVFDR